MTLEQENAELKSHINSLRDALENIAFEGEYDWIEAQVSIALNSTPTQSLAEHDRNVIAEFRARCEVVGYAEKGEIGYSYSHTLGKWHNIPLYQLPPIDNEEK